jgi:hypothetical protein
MAKISSVVGKIEPRSKNLEGSGIRGVTRYSKGVKAFCDADDRPGLARANRCPGRRAPPICAAQ